MSKRRRPRAKVETPAEELERLTRKPSSAEQTDAERDAMEEVRQLQKRGERKVGDNIGGPVEPPRGGAAHDSLVWSHIYDPPKGGGAAYGYKGSGYGVTKRAEATKPLQRWAGAKVPPPLPIPGTIFPIVTGLIPDVARDLGIKEDTVKKWHDREKLGDLRDEASDRPLVLTYQVELLRIAAGLPRDYSDSYLGESGGYCTDRRRSHVPVCEGCQRCGQERRRRGDRGVRSRRNRRWDDEPTKARASDRLPDDWWTNDDEGD